MTRPTERCRPATAWSHNLPGRFSSRPRGPARCCGRGHGGRRRIPTRVQPSARGIHSGGSEMARSVDRPTASDGTARRIPIVIGVSGPQGLADADRAPFEDAVRTILAQLRQLHPDSPFLVLSPLAEGAERLMARVGLAYGAALIVPLPMPRPDYERSFSSAQSRREFEDLLRQAECWFEVARAGGGNVTGVEQDVQLDTFLAVQCDVLIALWKGLTSDRLTGTVRVVRFMLEGCPHARAARGLLDTLDRSLVYHVVGGAPCEARRL